MLTISNTKHWLMEQSDCFSDKAAFITTSSVFLFKDVFTQAKSISHHLHKLGINENDHVGILFSHSQNFWTTVNAIWFLNAVPVPINSRNTPEEISVQLKKADVNFLLIDSDFSSSFSEQLASRNPSIKIIEFELNKFQIINHKSVIAEFNIHNPALILFTSGSSDEPKAVVHTFESLFHHVKAVESFFHLSANDLWLASLPLYHIGGFMILVRALLTGSSIAFPNSLKYDDIVESLRCFRPTYASFVSTTIQRFMENNFTATPNLKYVFLGGGPLSPNLCLKAIENGWPVVKVYGSTETCTMITALKPEEFRQKKDSVGKPIGDCTIIINNSSSISSETNIGEIVVQSNSLFKEYYKDNITISEKLINGFYHTGDFGWKDEKGFLYIKSRREDIIITGGENVSIKEVESMILSLSFASDAYVFGLSDERWGQVLCAALVTTNQNEGEIKNRLKEKLAGYKIPKRFYFVNEIPRNEMGKVKRSDLFKMLSLSDS